MEKLIVDDKKDIMVEGLTLNADILKNKKSKKIVITGARYENMTDFKDKTRLIRKLILSVEIEGSLLDYYPNKRSVNRLVAKYGDNAAKWIGKTSELEVKTLLVGENDRDVLFVRE